MNECKAAHRHDAIRCAHFGDEVAELHIHNGLMVGSCYQVGNRGEITVPLPAPLDAYWEHFCAQWLRGEILPMPTESPRIPARPEDAAVFDEATQ